MLVLYFWMFSHFMSHLLLTSWMHRANAVSLHFYSIHILTYAVSDVEGLNVGPAGWLHSGTNALHDH